MESLYQILDPRDSPMRTWRPCSAGTGRPTPTTSGDRSDHQERHWTTNSPNGQLNSPKPGGWCSICYRRSSPGTAVLVSTVVDADHGLVAERPRDGPPGTPAGRGPTAAADAELDKPLPGRCSRPGRSRMPPGLLAHAEQQLAQLRGTGPDSGREPLGAVLGQGPGRATVRSAHRRRSARPPAGDHRSPVLVGR